MTVERFEIVAGRLVLTVIVVAAACGLLGCTDDDEEFVAANGTVTWVSLEGGFFGIVGDDGSRYDPLDLPDGFREDGLRVRFKVLVRDDIGSVHMWGQTVEVLEISRL